jgi:hypothetical protein
LSRNSAFAGAYATQQPERYRNICEACAAPCSIATPRLSAEPEALMRLDIPALVVPGHDAAHAMSAARYLDEWLPQSEYWDVAVERQTEDNVPGRIIDFLGKAKP